MQIHAKYDELVDPQQLKPHPKNRNMHGQDQIERLAKLYKYHGVRHPIVVSKLTGYVVAGHGRRLAALQGGLKEVPVVYQDFSDLDAEYAFMVSDNAISDWSVLDFSGINADLADLGPDLDIEVLGIKNFSIDPVNLDPLKEWEGMPEYNQEDKTSFRQIKVHFNSNEDVEEFFKKIDQSFTDKTKSIWFPKQERLDTESKRYAD